MSDAIERLLRRKEEIEFVFLGDVNHMNLIELESMVLHHAQQIKDLAAHLLELKQLVTMQQQPTKLVGPDLVGLLNAAGFYQKKEWVGLTGVDINHIFAANAGYPERMIQAAEALLKEKNGD